MASLTPVGAPTTFAAPMATTTPMKPPRAATSASVPADARGGAHVVVRDLRKEFVLGGTVIPVLRGLDFELRPGEIASVVGASGVGKSTLLQVLGTLDAPTAGTITFDGVDAHGDERRRGWPSSATARSASSSSSTTCCPSSRRSRTP